MGSIYTVPFSFGICGCWVSRCFSTPSALHTQMTAPCHYAPILGEALEYKSHIQLLFDFILFSCFAVVGQREGYGSRYLWFNIVTVVGTLSFWFLFPSVLALLS